MGQQIHARLKKSWIRMEQSQRDTVRTLGFRRLNQVVTVPDNPATRGMFRKIGFAVELLDGPPQPGFAWKGITVEAGKGPKPAAKKPAVKKKKASKRKASKLADKE